MKYISGVIDLVKEYSKLTQKPVLYLSAGDEPPEVLREAVSFLTLSQSIDLFANGFIVVICESVDHMNYLYEHVVGDDGPTSYNKYDGPCRIYALTIDRGIALNENT